MTIISILIIIITCLKISIHGNINYDISNGSGGNGNGGCNNNGNICNRDIDNIVIGSGSSGTSRSILETFELVIVSPARSSANCISLQ